VLIYTYLIFILCCFDVIVDATLYEHTSARTPESDECSAYLLIEQQWDSNVVRLRPIRTHDILQRQDTLGKGKLRSPVGGTIYANVTWAGMKWKYAPRPLA